MSENLKKKKKHKKRHRSENEEVKQDVTEEEKTLESLLFDNSDSEHVHHKHKHKKKKRKVVESLEEENLDPAQSQQLDDSAILTNDNEPNFVAIHKQQKKKKKKRLDVDVEPNEDIENGLQEDIATVLDDSAILTNDNEPSVAILKHHKKKKKKKKRLELNVEPNEDVEYRLQDDVASVSNDKKVSKEKSKSFNSGSARGSTVGLRKKLVEEEPSDDDTKEEEGKLLTDMSIEINWKLSTLHKLPSLRLEEKTVRQMKAEGMKLRKGHWTREEELILEKNWGKFQKIYKLQNPSLLLGLKKSSMSKGQITNFTRFLGRGLENRTLISIYQQARRMLNPSNYKGRLLDLEEKAVGRLVTEHGHKWEKIGRMLGRTGESVRTTWERIRDRYKGHGRWSESEDRRLMKALAKVTGQSELVELEHHNLPWKEIAAVVKTRNRRQCRIRWLEKLASDFNPNRKESTEKWTIIHKIKLLNDLTDNGFLTEADIPWDDLAKDYGLANCSIMRQKWYAMRTKAPNYYIKTFREILDWLLTNYLPTLEEKSKVELSQIENDI